jgi:hypothetical protein
MKTWVRHSLNVGALTAGALLASGVAAQAQPTMTSTDNLGLLNGTQALVPVQVPVNLCGNAVAVAGTAGATCHGGSAASLEDEWSFHHFQQATGGNLGVGNGTQLAVPIQVPVNVCGNAVSVLGAATAGCADGADTGMPDPDYRYSSEQGSYQPEYSSYDSADPTMLSSGDVGVLNGTQALVPIQVPINICGNTIGALGVALGGCEGGATAS